MTTLRKNRWQKARLNEPVEQLGEPDHEGVVAAGQAELDGAREQGVPQVGWLAQLLGHVDDLGDEHLEVLALVQLEGARALVLGVGLLLQRRDLQASNE